MLQRTSTILGVGLVALWIIGLTGTDTTLWLTWLDGMAAVCAFTIAAWTPEYTSRAARMSGPFILSACLFTLSLIGFATSSAAWLCWWTLAFSLAFFGLGAACAVQKENAPLSLSEFDQDRFKRSA